MSEGYAVSNNRFKPSYVIAVAVAMITSLAAIFFLAFPVSPIEDGSKLLDGFKEKGIVVEKSMPYSKHLNVHLISVNSPEVGYQEDIVFTDRSNTYMIAGDVLNTEGDTQRDKAFEMLSPAKSWSIIKPMIEGVDVINLGDKSLPTAYLFMSPICPHCSDEMSYIMGEKAQWSSKINIAILPMATTELVESLWAQIYQSDDKAGALQEVYGKLVAGTLKPEGFILLEHQQNFKKVQAVAQLMRITSTPSMVIPSKIPSQAPIIVTGFSEEGLGLALQSLEAQE